MCDHLKPLENEIKALGVKETYRGQPWSKNCREWVYFDCRLDIASIRNRYHLPDFIEEHRNDDMRSGLEHGLVCTLCHDAIMGVHPEVPGDKPKFE